eukprot:5396434-Amphidinium_carterae.4
MLCDVLVGIFMCKLSCDAGDSYAMCLTKFGDDIGQFYAVLPGNGWWPKESNIGCNCSSLVHEDDTVTPTSQGNCGLAVPYALEESQKTV